MEIKFKNGSIIKSTPNKNTRRSNVPFQIMSVDIDEHSDDISCVSYYCTNCKAFFKVDRFEKCKKYKPIVFTQCSNCKVSFRGWGCIYEI